MVQERLFEPTKNKIINLLKEIIKEVESTNQDIVKILLVGGFLNRNIYRNSSGKLSVIKLSLHPKPLNSVLKGAVLIGHTPRLISHRIMRFTYGIRSCEPFDRNKHDAE